MVARFATGWTPILEAGEAAQALRVARDVAARLRETARIESAAAAAREQTGFPKSVHWQPHGVAQGYAGLALLCGAADTCMPDEGWDTSGHQHLQCAVRAAEQRPQLSYGMSSGIGGLAFAAWSLSRQGTRYRNLRRYLDEALTARVTADATRLLPVDHGLSVSRFDMISGFAGVGRFLLQSDESRAPHGP